MLFEYPVDRNELFYFNLNSLVDYPMMMIIIGVSSFSIGYYTSHAGFYTTFDVLHFVLTAHAARDGRVYTKSIIGTFY